MKKRYPAALLTAIILMNLYVTSCAEAASNSGETTATAASETESETTALVAEIPDDAYFDGHTFTFLITGNTENTWEKNDFKAEEENGEVLNDARFKRNLAVEDRLGITIETVENYGSAFGAGSGYLAFQTCVMAGDTSYDAGMIAGYDCATLACGGYLYDLNTLPYMDMTKPWWDHRVNEDLTINGKLYYTTGDISTADNDATNAILFSKQLITDFGLEDPYELVKSGKWTIDKMIEMGTGVAGDLNGDTKYDKNDRFAAIIWDDTIMGMVNATGSKCATVQPDGTLELTLYNDDVLSMFEKYTAFFDRTIAYHYQRTSYDITDPVNMFANNQALFFTQLLDLVTYFRDMQTDFGILPFPKLDEEQEGYHSTIGSWHSVFLAVPLVQEDAERTGIVLEALAAESYYTVTPAYYEKTLIGKYTRDEESADMIDIILSTRVYDLGWFYQIGEYNENIMDMFRQNKTDFTSMYDTYKNSALAKIEEINEAFAQVN